MGCLWWFVVDLRWWDCGFCCDSRFVGCLWWICGGGIVGFVVMGGLWGVYGGLWGISDGLRWWDSSF